MPRSFPLTIPTFFLHLKYTVCTVIFTSIFSACRLRRLRLKVQWELMSFFYQGTICNKNHQITNKDECL